MMLNTSTILYNYTGWSLLGFIILLALPKTVVTFSTVLVVPQRRSCSPSGDTILTSASSSLKKPTSQIRLINTDEHYGRSSIGASINTELFLHRRELVSGLVGGVLGTITAAGGLEGVSPTWAQVFFDPALYGDQELRISAVDSVKETIRRAILQNPDLAPSFYQLSLLDGLSYNVKTQQNGPDGTVLRTVLSLPSSDSKSEYLRNLQQAALAILDAERNLRRRNAITVADAVAIAGAEAIESIGGPVLTVQLGRTDPSPGSSNKVIQPPLDLFSGRYSNQEVAEAFRRAGLTDREMTALLGGLLTLEVVEKARTTEDWKAASRPKFRETGKLGRMSDFKPLTDDDIKQAELEADPDYQDPDAGWYIADSFGTREERFGARLAKGEISEKSFNRYLREVYDTTLAPSKRVTGGKDTSAAGLQDQFGWVAMLLTDPELPTCQTWLSKYSSSNLNYLKDLNIAYNAVTQLGAVYTGGKYESLLKGKPRKSLNDDDLKLF